jgi:Cof subfamily protein (haloacid dehalogenase superfamily)
MTAETDRSPPDRRGLQLPTLTGVSDEHTHDLTELARMPAPDIRLVVTDMDGTLLDDDRQIHDQFWPLLDELDARGIAFSPASGRHHVSLRRQFAPIAERVTYIASNGAHVLVGSQEVHSDCLDASLAREVLTTMAGVQDARAVLVGKAGAYIQRGDEEAFRWMHAYVPPLTVVDDIADAVETLLSSGDGVLNIGIFDNRAAEQNSLVALAPLRDRLNIMATHPTWVDVVSPTADKGHAVAALQADMGIGPDQTMVFGDFLNDLQMMDRAAYSFAMANAHPDVSRRASWRAPANSANGVVRTIRAVLGIDAPRPRTP